MKVNAVCPGWVRTDMGGRAATRSIPEGTAGIVLAATLPADGPSGVLMRDGHVSDWQLRDLRESTAGPDPAPRTRERWRAAAVRAAPAWGEIGARKRIE